MSEKKKISLNDRETISIGIMRKLPLKHIAKLIGKHVSSVTNEIKKHRVFVRGNYYAGNDCRYAQECNKKHICGDMECFMYCYTCPKSCHSFCEEYFTNKCQKYEKPPYVCNACENRRYCKDDRYFYDSKVANKEAQEARSVSRRGIHLTDEELQDLNMIISTAIRKGQPMSHIFATYEDELPVTSRTVYTYIDMGILGVKNIDLRRQAGYRRRRMKRTESSVLTQQYRQGRSYEDFQKLIAEQGDSKSF